MASLTLAKAIDYFSRELGCTPSEDRDILLDTITEAIEFVLFNGGGEILKEWTVVAREGRFTLPRDLETPVKYKFSRTPNFGFGTFHSPYYSFSSNAIKDCCQGYWDWDPALEGKAGRVFTQYRPPQCGVRLLATTRNILDEGKSISVSGNSRGKSLAPMHNGFKTEGEILKIYHESNPDKKYGAYPFDEITGVVKDDNICDWMMLSGLGLQDNKFYFLSHYHPDEVAPSYREAELYSCPQTCGEIVMHILGRLNPSTRYIRDEAIIPITSFEMLKLLAKRARYDDSGDFAEVAVMEARVRTIIKKQFAYQQKPTRQMSVALGASGASLTNM